MSHISGKVPVIVSNPYESLVIDEEPRNNKITHCYSSKYFWFAICHCILFLLLIIIALIVCNHLGYTPIILQSLQTLRASAQPNGTTTDEKSELIDQAPCPTGYILFEETNSCYKATPLPTLFEDAESACQADGARLTSIHSESENTLIVGLYHESFLEARRTELLKLATKFSFWIGMTRFNGSFGWLDESPVSYRNWYSREETTNLDNQRASIYAIGYEWHAVSGSKRGFVCKKPSNSASKAKKTLTKSPCPNKYTWLKDTGSCYQVYVNQTTFEKAADTCAKESSRLVSIHSEIETIFLRGLVEKEMEQNDLKKLNTWIGLTHKKNELKWVDGSPVNYGNWSPGEPNHSEDYYATVMLYWDTWKSAQPSTENGFICKKY